MCRDVGCLHILDAYKRESQMGLAVVPLVCIERRLPLPLHVVLHDHSARIRNCEFRVQPAIHYLLFDHLGQLRTDVRERWMVCLLCVCAENILCDPMRLSAYTG
jgi:hypothetical protein